MIHILNLQAMSRPVNESILADWSTISNHCGKLESLA